MRAPLALPALLALLAAGQEVPVPQCPRAEEVPVNARTTCGECPPFHYSAWYCGSWLGWWCTDDCYSCWLCELPPTEAPTRAPTEMPTRAPTTPAPTKAPTSAPTKAPTLHVTTVSGLQQQLEACVARNQLTQELAEARRDALFAKAAGADLVQRRVAYGLGPKAAMACLEEDGSLAAETADEGAACRAFASLYFIRERFLPNIGLGSPEELAALGWLGTAALCPQAIEAAWQVLPHGAEYQRVQLRNGTGLTKAQAATHVNATAQRLRTGPAERAGLVRFGGNLSAILFNEPTTPADAHAFGLDASLEILAGFAAALEHEGSVAAGPRDSCRDDLGCTTLVAWTSTILLEDGSIYARAQEPGTCRCKTDAPQHCPPGRSIENSEACTKHTFHNPVVDAFFARTLGPTSKPTFAPSPAPAPIGKATESGKKEQEDAAAAEADSGNNYGRATVAGIAALLAFLLALVALALGLRAYRSKRVARGQFGENRAPKRTEMVFVRNRANLHAPGIDSGASVRPGDVEITLQ